MSEAKIQLRGHCQCCCRIQAVQGSRMSKHGYEVKNRGDFGWFSGVCGGHKFAPVEVERVVLDQIVAQIRQECAGLLEKANNYIDGTAHPAQVGTGRYDPETRQEICIAWEEAADYTQKSELKRQIWRLQSRAQSGNQQADQMVEIADRCHGKPLQEVKKDEGPEPIPVGQKRVLPIGKIGTVQLVYKGMAHFKVEGDEKFTRKMSTRSWRLLAKAE